ncbi:MAG: single-stranded-DNA-specific exonuclease RecJ [Candidatus Omnitrophota bacterium]|nr:single-stranded-DNA-specific exonuclease RecJ [Candidatus Omnitrophota bacterium]
MKRKNWNIRELTPAAAEYAQAWGISSILAQIFINRNVDACDIKNFLNPSLTNLHAAALLPDIEKATSRVQEAVRRQEKVLVFGDYDVDGLTSLAIFYEFAKLNRDLFSFHIPHRVNDGYGLNEPAIKKAKKNGVSLIIAFDCGTGADREIARAKELGIDVIVVDHHHHKSANGESVMPYALVNPKRPDSIYPFSDLSSGALSFKFLQALTGKPCVEVLDLVALSLVCDVVPLKGENRILLKEGLRALRASTRPSIKALCQVSSVRQGNIDTFHIGFALGPRLNASGRIACAHEALDIFLTDDHQEALRIAEKLKGYNVKRRDIEATILKEADAMVEREFANDYAIVVHNDHWHPGVLGIVASRLTDKYYRPSFVISCEESVGRGSGRSIHSVHLMEMLAQCSELLQEYGGHRKAAGVQLAKTDIEPFRKRLNTLIAESVAPEDLVPVLAIELRIDFSDITMSLVGELEGLEPFGEDNPKPLFASFDVAKKTAPKKTGIGYSVWFTQGGITYEGIVYDKNILEIIEFSDMLDIAYSLERNSFHNTPKLVIRDARFACSES